MHPSSRLVYRILASCRLTEIIARVSIRLRAEAAWKREKKSKNSTWAADTAAARGRGDIFLSSVRQSVQLLAASCLAWHGQLNLIIG